MKLKLDVLTNDEIYQIHLGAMELLEKVGVKIEADEALDMMNQAGAQVDRTKKWVKIPEYLVKESLKKAPSRFLLYGRDPKFQLRMGGSEVNYGTIGTPTKIIDIDTGKVRPATTKDAETQLRIVDSLKHINCSQVDAWPNDIPVTLVHTFSIMTWAKNSRKPYGIGMFGKLPSQDMINMAAIVAGGEEELMKAPRLLGYHNPVSPLQTSLLLVRGSMVFAKYNQPQIIAPEAQAGSTAPSTLAGLLAQQTAENLGVITLVELTNPGAPVLFGTVSTIADMKTGNICLGSVESGLLNIATAQLARYYNLPSRGAGCTTESKVYDMQAGFEKMITLYLAASGGINYLTSGGTLESTLTESFETLVLDDELCGMVERARAGIEVNEDTLALEVIKEAASKGRSFLGHKHTLTHFEKEHFIPLLIDRNRREIWEKKKDSKDIIQVARDTVREIIKTHQPEPLDKDIEKQLLEYHEKVKSRTLDDYKKAEGVTGKVSGLPF
jgi:trimethylamine--corrinoid protein Co-methyltransferase